MSAAGAQAVASALQYWQIRLMHKQKNETCWLHMSSGKVETAPLQANETGGVF